MKLSRKDFKLKLNSSQRGILETQKLQDKRLRDFTLSDIFSHNYKIATVIELILIIQKLSKFLITQMFLLIIYESFNHK